MVVDDFYPDPYQVRETALQGEYFESQRYVGLDCDQKLLHKELDGAISRLVGQPVKGQGVDPGKALVNGAQLEQHLSPAIDA